MTLKLQNKLYIGGAFVSGAAGTDRIINPANEDVIGEAPVGSVDDARSAVAAAHDAFVSGPWRRLSRHDRIAHMRRFYEALEHRKDEIIAILIAEAGATVSLANGAQWATGMKHFRYYMEAAAQDFTKLSRPEVTPAAGGVKWLGTSVVRYDPVGVVAVITPYNYPFMLNLVKSVPALLMGNTVVLKPSPYTPYSALVLGDIAREAGLPDGVFNVVTGGLDVGELLTTDKRVRLVTFTGSDMVGAAIMAQAAPTLKRLLLELGGKSAMIVRPDADIGKAVSTGLRGFSSHAGQGCALNTRHLVHNSIRADYVARLKEAAERVVVGDPADPRTEMGPLIRAVARDRAEKYVQIGLDEGARLVTGGKRPDHLTKGFFFQPTFFDDVANGSRLAQEEIFGPIAAVIGYDTDEEAIRIANDSDFALACYILTNDAGTAYEMAQQINSGRCAINGGAGTQLSDEPFGGNLRSGFGRENGIEGLLEFTNANAISFHAA
ncbi:aldehyde dehydrogenase family protein [Sphingomonas histidinilytica]|jgi:acyl-CoA reductase-like NAD-dependent aldehyde dehydrogenase|uniref:Aldehyde dehydrogenase (NAD+) n=1 Tax=Rhizorhabdus histidinilytica TaxID=439228 RepID=A0A1T5EQK1_9SPHN|nr:aldehyde dehydrogenase family protein [Rhizorhabdus histidinilytica]MBO9376667.1 aldehyde dehydrogenase family protein [Rhizorhabdus histidinilytica]QEH76886.1 aldehyde dehydrogenase family protein [Sphingomonas sp. C8-2]SKB86194.1 aldehyde dehydrogenase (NAD+) [Rhizorhabdus histidinilytica]